MTEEKALVPLTLDAGTLATMVNPGKYTVPEYYSNHKLETYQKCPRMFEYQSMRQLVAKVVPRALSFGAAMHKGLEVWYKIQLDKVPDETLQEIVAKLFEKMELDRDARKMTRLQLREELMVYSAIADLPELHATQAGDRRNEILLENLLRAYAKKYAWEPFKLVDVEFSFTIILPNGRPYIGNIDLVIDWANEILPVEHKSTSSLWGFGDKFNPHQAVTGYVIGLKQEYPNYQNRVVVNALNLTKRKDHSVKPEEDLLRFPNITRDNEQLSEWLVNTVATISDIERDIERGYFEMRTNSCNYCSMRFVCEANVGAEREYQLERHFDVKPFDQKTRRKAEIVADMVG